MKIAFRILLVCILVFSSAAPMKHGTFKLSALIDSENTVSETNEKNNSTEAIVVKP